MSIHWPQMTFSRLKAAWECPHATAHPDEEQAMLAGRFEDILNFVESDRIWPAVANSRRKVTPALQEVLAKLPENEFEWVESNLQIVLDDPATDLLAVNVPPPDRATAEGSAGVCTVVFLRSSWKLSETALTGLVAHELAHSFVSGRDYAKDEQLTNEKARSWGFADELQVLAEEKRTLVQ
jgi:hypothetical protein